MIHHLSVEVTDLERSGKFYDGVLGALGWRRQIDNEVRIAWGITRPIFYAVERPAPVVGSGHIAVVANSIPAVKGAWEAGTLRGGTDDGAPGQRPQYGATYYSAYLLDPDGHRIELAVGSF